MEKRIHRNLTLGKETDEKLTALCGMTGRTRGRIIDLLVSVMYKALHSNTLHCVTGDLCRNGAVALNPELFR